MEQFSFENLDITRASNETIAELGEVLWHFNLQDPLRELRIRNISLHVGPGSEADIEAQQRRRGNNTRDSVLHVSLQPPVVGGHAADQREGVGFHAL